VYSSGSYFRREADSFNNNTYRWRVYWKGTKVYDEHPNYTYGNGGLSSVVGTDGVTYIKGNVRDNPRFDDNDLTFYEVTNTDYRVYYDGGDGGDGGRGKEGQSGRNGPMGKHGAYLASNGSKIHPVENSANGDKSDGDFQDQTTPGFGDTPSTTNITVRPGDGGRGGYGGPSGGGGGYEAGGRGGDYAGSGATGGNGRSGRNGVATQFDSNAGDRNGNGGDIGRSSGGSSYARTLGGDGRAGKDGGSGGSYITENSRVLSTTGQTI
jgi:hypothetical protein